MGLGELSDHLRMQSTEIFEAFDDFYLAFESLNYVRTDSQLQQNANKLWMEQMEVYKNKIEPLSEDFIKACANQNIDINEEVKSLIRY